MPPVLLGYAKAVAIVSVGSTVQPTIRLYIVPVGSAVLDKLFKNVVADVFPSH